MKKVVVNKDACIGCGACVSIAPNHFEFDDNGLSVAIKPEDTEASDVVNAIESCPTNAIAIDDACDCEDCHCNKNEE